jgi:hypothetical protein
LHQNQPTQQALDAGLAGSDVGDETWSEEICALLAMMEHSQPADTTKSTTVVI